MYSRGCHILLGSFLILQILSLISAVQGVSSYGIIVANDVNASVELREYNYAKAYFGPTLSFYNYFTGIIHKVVPEDGCATIKQPPDDEGVSWIAVVRRSDPRSATCTFIEKVYNAQRAGYSGAIIYDYIPDEDLTPMYSRNKTLESLVSIPSVFVDYDAGIDMQTLSYPDQSTDMASVKFRPYKEDLLDPYKILIPMAFSFVGILLIAVIVMVVRWCQALRRRRRSRISKSQLKKIPLVKYQLDDQYDCCAICLDDYVEGEKVRLLPCSHTYHKKCIDPWLLKNKRTCPVCKRRVVPRRPRRNGRSEGDSGSSDSEDLEGGVINERRPLLGPPNATHSSSDSDAEASAANYGATEAGIHTAGVSGSGSDTNIRSINSRPRSAQSSGSLAGRWGSGYDGESSDDDAGDLRCPADFLAQRRTSTGTPDAGAHSLRSMPGNFAQIETYIPPLPPLNREPGHEAMSSHNSGLRGETNIAMERETGDNGAVAFECRNEETAPLVNQNDII